MMPFKDCILFVLPISMKPELLVEMPLVADLRVVIWQTASRRNMSCVCVVIKCAKLKTDNFLNGFWRNLSFSIGFYGFLFGKKDIHKEILIVIVVL